MVATRIHWHEDGCHEGGECRDSAGASAKIRKPVSGDLIDDYFPLVTKQVPVDARVADPADEAARWAFHLATQFASPCTRTCPITRTRPDPFADLR